MEFLKTTVTHVEHPGPEYTLLAFRPDKEMPGDPGQFVMIRGADFGSDPILPRAFSLVRSGKEGAVLVKNVGKATSRLAAMREGDTLMVLGPLGNRFTMPDRTVRPLLVAGGVGVAPLLFMAERLRAEGRDATFVYGGRSAADLLYLDWIDRVSGDLRLTTEDGSTGTKGRVTDILADILTHHPKTAAYACGPLPMLKALHHVLDAKNTPLEVALEQAMACGMGTCKGCAVHDRNGAYKYVCSDGPVFQSGDVFGKGA